MKNFMSMTKPTFNPKMLMLGAATMLVVGSTLMPELALAGTGGTEFDSIWTTLTDWMEGTLGRIAAGAMILVGIIAGVARQSLMSFAVGIGGGLGLYNAPTVLDGVMTAGLEHMPAATQAVIAISNGLGG